MCEIITDQFAFCVKKLLAENLFRLLVLQYVVLEEIRLIFNVQLYYSKMIESLSESSTDDK